MATYDPTARVIRLNTLNTQYKQQIAMIQGAAIHQRFQFVRVDRAPGGVVKLVFFNPYSLQYVFQTIQNQDALGNIKTSVGGNLWYNANKVMRFRGESDYLQLKQAEDARVEITPEPTTDLEWKSAIHYFGVRDALIGGVPFFGGTPNR